MELRAGWMSMNRAGVANMVASGSKLTQEGAAGAVSGGGPIWVGWMAAILLCGM